jgi:hypothetical protein
MSIPTVPGSEIDVATPNRAAKLDAGAITAPARARLSAAGSRYRGEQQMAGAVEGASAVLAGLSEDMLKVRRANIAADADFRMRAAQQSFIESIRGDQNENDWADRAQTVAEQTRQDIFASHDVPPGMRPELENSIKGWGQALQIKTQTMAQVQTINRAELSIRKSYDEAGRDGDAVGMANAVALGRSSKLDPVAMDEMEQNIPRALATTAIENGLRANPQGTHDLLVSGASLPIADQKGNAIVPSKVFAPKELQSLINTARVQSAAWQRTNGENLLQTAADPITGLVPDNEIKAKMASKEISEAFGRSLIAAQERKVKAETAASEAENKRQLAEFDRAERDRFNVLQSAIHDPIAWGANPEEYAKALVEDAADISTPALRQRAINDANRQLAAVKKNGQIAEKPVEAQIMELMRKDVQTQGAMVPLSVSDVAAVGAKTHFFSADEPARSAQTRYEQVPGGIEAIRKMKPEDFAAAYGEKATKDQVIEAINVHAARLEAQMRDWFKSPEGEKATFEQANAHRQELERPYVMDAVRATLSRKAPAVVRNKEDYDALPPGAPYDWNGQIKVKK